MAGIILAVMFVIGIVIGLPIHFTLGISSLAALLVMNTIPLVIIPQRLVAGINSFSLLAIPCFIFLGKVMSYSGGIRRIVNFSNSLVGFITGGLALINIVASMFFAGVSGSATADTSSIGSILIPSMIEEGYDADFSAAVTASSSTCGPIIPPSITMVIYGVIAGVSITDLFLGGYIPGILLGVSLMIVAYIIAKRRNYPRHSKSSLKKVFITFKKAFYVLIIPLIIIGGILSGIFTVTESAGVAVLYALIMSLFIYKDIKFSDLPQIMFDTSIQIAVLMIIAASAFIFAWVLTILQIPQTITTYLFKITSNPLIILLLLNIFFIIIGTFMEAKSAMFILVPILLPLVKSVGIDPVHFGVVIVFNLLVGLVTPPVGLCLNLSAKIANISLNDAFKAVLPFLAVQLIVLFLITYIPQLVLFLPHLFD